MPEVMAKGKTRGAGAGGGRGELPALRVRYYRRMKLQRVYTAEVFWSKSERPPRGEVTVRLIVAGAQVLPSEHVLDAAKPDVKATFHVTPLAKGWLPNSKLEILSGDRKVQEIALASKVVSQRLTWLLFLLTFIGPLLYLRYVTYSPVAEPVREWMISNYGLDAKKKPAKVDLGDEPTLKMESMIKSHPRVDKEVELFLKKNLPDTPDFLKQTAVETALKDARTAVAEGYKELVGISAPGNEPIAFYVFVTLLVLTLLSAFLHSAKRRKVTGKPIPVPAKRTDEDDEE